MLSEQENTLGNDRNCKKLQEIKCNRADSINSSITTQFRHSKPLLFPLLLLFPFLANIHEYQKEAHVLKNRFPVPCDIFCAMWKEQLDHTPFAITTLFLLKSLSLRQYYLYIW